MIKLSYVNESGKLISFQVADWDAANCVADALVSAPIDLDYLEYQDGNHIGVFNLNTFERC